MNHFSVTNPTTGVTVRRISRTAARALYEAGQGIASSSGPDNTYRHAWSALTMDTPASTGLDWSAYLEAALAQHGTRSPWFWIVVDETPPTVDEYRAAARGAFTLTLNLGGGHGVETYGDIIAALRAEADSWEEVGHDDTVEVWSDGFGTVHHGADQTTVGSWAITLD